MKIDSIITEKKSRKKSKQVKASDKAPKLIKPNTGHESPHPMQGKMVGENNQLRELFFKFANDTNVNLTEEELQIIKEAPGDIRKFLTILGLMGGLAFGVGKAMDASSFKQSELGKELAMAAQQGDMVAAYHLENLDLYADQYMMRTIQNLKIAYIDDANREDVNAFLSDPKRFPGLKKIKNESKIDEAPYSADKITLLKAVIDEIEDKAQDEDGIKFLKKLAQLVGKRIYKRDNGKLALESPIPFNKCPKCGGGIVHESQLNEKQDACYHKVKSRYKVWPSAYASGALVKCRKVGAKNWGNKSKK